LTTKTLIIGLDGVPRRLLEALAAAGVMPATSRLIRDGHLHDLEASIPEISSVSWSSFMTGANPGGHGIFGFTDLVAGTRKIRFPRFGDLATSTFWDRLGERGYRSVVINQPSTFPVRPFPGALVAGFVALDLDRSVYPARHIGKLRELGYVIDVDMNEGRREPGKLLSSIAASLAAREAALGFLWRAEPWDVFEIVVTETDRLQHVLWDALEEREHPLHQAVLDFYFAVDGLVGRTVERFREECPEGPLYVLSDHGFTRARRELRLNAWLEEMGYLSFSDPERGSLEGLSPSTRAFALDPGRIYLAGPDRETLREEIAARLLALEHEGERVIRAVHRREEIYRGPLAARGPNLVAQANAGFDIKGSIKAREVFGEPVLAGMHDPHAFLLTDRSLPYDAKVDDRLGIDRVAGLIEARYRADGTERLHDP
jgi:predicted AlkP superfamily phosphohydrolase/phosphomutase